MPFMLNAIHWYWISGGLVCLLFLALSELLHCFRKEEVFWSHRIFLFCFGMYLIKIFSDYYLIQNRVGSLQLLQEIQWSVPIGVGLIFLSNHCKKISIVIWIGLMITVIRQGLRLFYTSKLDFPEILYCLVGIGIGYMVGALLRACIPALRRRIGVFRKINGRYCRKKKDAGEIVLLILCMLCFVVMMSIRSHNDLQGEEKKTLVEHQMGRIRLADQVKQSEKPFAIDVTAKNVYVLRLDSATILYEKNSNEKIAPASTTKMLTALTVLKYCATDEVVTVSDEVNLIAKDASRAWLRVGSQLTIRQLLSALLLPSGNDAAYTLAVYTGRVIAKDPSLPRDQAIAEFIEAMNKEADALGASDSHFLSPDGYDTEGQYTTASNLAYIAAACLQNEVLQKIVKSYQESQVWTSGESMTYTNTNVLLNPKSAYYDPDVIGLKTGNSGKAGACLVSAATIGTGTYISVVMGSTDRGRWEDSKAIFENIKKEE